MRDPKLHTAHRSVRSTPAWKSIADAGRRATGGRAWPYVGVMALAGAAILFHAVTDLAAQPPEASWWILLGLTLISGTAVLKLPAVAVNFSISDVFTLTAAAVFGPSAGTVAVAVDSLVISGRLTRQSLPLQRVIFNAAAPPVTMWLAAHAFFSLSGFLPLRAQAPPVEVVVPWLLFFAGLYFVLNTGSIAMAIALHERLHVVDIWRRHFQSLWLTSVGSALGAAGVVVALQVGTYELAVLMLPLALAVILHFAYRNATGRTADQLRHLSEVNRLHVSTIEALAHAIDARDAVTHGHIRRVQNLAAALARRLALSDRLELRALEAAALLHDIGKLAIPDHILNKPGRLTAGELERMKAHAAIGAEILSEVEFPYPVVPIVRHHHENWDGSGYPDGLVGDVIPIGARILAVVDCYDALTSDRPYRRALSGSDALSIVVSRGGTMYDPRVVEAFVDLAAETRIESPGGGLPARPLAALATDIGDQREPARIHPRIAMEIGSNIATGASWQALATALTRLPGADAVVVFGVDDLRHCLAPIASAGPLAPPFDRLSIPIGERLSGWVASTRQPMLNVEAAVDLFDAAPHLRAAAAVACDAPSGLVVVALYSRLPAPFTTDHQQIIETAVAFLSDPGVRSPAPHPQHRTSYSRLSMRVTA
jgi:putative nucleotidyltransferase with HDIG domain